MKKSKIQDERILFERREIQSRGFAFIVYILLVAIVIQEFIMQAPFKQYAAELFILISCGVYNLIANVVKGIDLWNVEENPRNKILLSTFVSGFISVILYAILSGKYELYGLAIYFISFIAFFFIIQIIFRSLVIKRRENIDKSINDDDV